MICHDHDKSSNSNSTGMRNTLSMGRATMILLNIADYIDLVIICCIGSCFGYRRLRKLDKFAVSFNLLEQVSVD